MALGFADVEVAGITVLGIPPVGRVHIELQDYATGLYGINGAGKTRILSAIRGALRGRAPAKGQVLLHLRIRTGLVVDQSNWTVDLTHSCWERVSEERGRTDEYRMLELMTGPPERDDLPSWNLPDVIAAHLATRLERQGNEPVYQLLDDYLTPRQDASPILLVFTPIGVESALWRVHVGADMSRSESFRESFEAEVRFHALRQLGEVPDPVVGLYDSADTTGWFDEEIVSAAYVARLSNPTILCREGTLWPEWSTIPVMTIGEFDRPPVAVVDAIGEAGWPDLDGDTMDFLRDPIFGVAREGQFIDTLMDEEVLYKPAVVDALGKLEHRADEIRSLLLPGSPRPRFELGQPKDWLTGDLPHWEADVAQRRIPLSDLSWAERRWVSNAISIALAEASPRFGRVLLIADEPERGLHRRAEAQLCNTFHGLADSGVPSISATHSSFLLNDTRVAVSHVFRDGVTGLASTKTLEPSVRSEVERDRLADELGLTLADLYQLTRVFVIVEGPHDRAVIESVLGSNLDSAFGRCLAMEGAKALTAMLNAPMIFDYTDANVVVVLDNIEERRLRPVWERFTTAERKGRREDAMTALHQLERFGTGESKWLREFGEQAAREGRLDRISIYTLSYPDVICYIPRSTFMPNRTDTWDELLQQWSDFRAAGGGDIDLKSWLKTYRGASISVNKVRKGAASMVEDGTPIHRDLVELGLRIQSAASPVAEAAKLE